MGDWFCAAARRQTPVVFDACSRCHGTQIQAKPRFSSFFRLSGTLGAVLDVSVFLGVLGWLHDGQASCHSRVYKVALEGTSDEKTAIGRGMRESGRGLEATCACMLVVTTSFMSRCRVNKKPTYPSVIICRYLHM